MSDADQVSGLLTTNSTSAGSLLRQARVAKGMHIATLAASIKVPQRKLELLEADQWDQLPDMAFARALAQTVCRCLKMDPTTVMGLLPSAQAHRIEQLGEGLNAPFRERAGQQEPSSWAWTRHPAVWGGALVLGATLAVYAMPAQWASWPSDWLGGLGRADEPARSQPSNSEGTTGNLVTETMPATILGAPIPDVIEPLPAASSVLESMPASASASSLSNLDSANTPLALRVTSPSWIEVQDGKGKTLLARMVQPQESVLLGGALPLRLKIGNASVTEVRFRGQPIDLAPTTRDNVARVDLN
ncbi:MAG: helix-turn-helix domain-containing protein [Pseudomonadota bacterium]